MPDPEDPADADARRVAVFARNLGLGPGATLKICREVRTWAEAQDRLPDDHARLTEVRRRLLVAAG